MIHKDIKYFFACSVGALPHCIRKDFKFNEKTYKFYNKDESFYHYPNILISAGHNYHEENSREAWGLSEDALVFGDSGGFQLATGVLKANSENFPEIRKKILMWLENNCDVSMNLDVPPFLTGKRGTPTKEHFNECMKKSIDNYKYFADNRTGNTKFLNVLQGRSKEQLQTWYDNVKDFEFDGWAIGGIRGANKFIHIVNGIRILIDSGEFEKHPGQYLHLLGISSYENLIYLQYVQQCLNNRGIDVQITCDSSSPAMTATYGRYITHFTPHGQIVLSMTRNHMENIPPLTKLPCTCPVCSEVETVNKMVSGDSTGYALMTLHNLYKYIGFLNFTSDALMYDNFDQFSGLFKMRTANNLRLLHQVFYDNKPLSMLNNQMKLKETELSQYDTEKVYSEFFTG